MFCLEKTRKNGHFATSESFIKRMKTLFLREIYSFSALGLSPDDECKIEILNKGVGKTSATHNKDNRSNLFVTIFAVTPAVKKTTVNLVPGCPQMLSINIRSKENDESTSILRPSLLHWLRLNSCTVSQKWSHVTLYRDTQPTEPTCTRRAKIAPCFAHYCFC